VRMAETILVLHEGTVAEAGTHAELLEKGGIYATLFRLQARGYVTADLNIGTTTVSS